jgi:hypothetical protein
MVKEILESYIVGVFKRHIEPRFGKLEYDYFNDITRDNRTMFSTACIDSPTIPNGLLRRVKDLEETVDHLRHLVVTQVTK